MIKPVIWSQKTLLVFILALLFVFLVAGCGRFIRNTKTALGMATKGASPQERPDFYAASHGSFSNYPSEIYFYPDADIDSETFPGWVDKELKCDLRITSTAAENEHTLHTRYSQYYQGYPVLGGGYILHSSLDGSVSATGLLYDQVALENKRSLSPQEALARLEESFPDYRCSGNESLVVVPVRNGAVTDFFLCYKLHLLLPGEGLFYDVYVDAEFGVVRIIDPVTITVAGIGSGINSEGKTLEFETQHTNDIRYPEGEIAIMPVQDGYRLFDAQRNLHTMTMDNASDVSIDDFVETEQGVRLSGWDYLSPARDIIESDNFWENHPAAVDAHWAITKSYDYYSSAHGRLGFDGNNGYMPAYVNFYKNMNRAYYNSNKHYIALGDGKIGGNGFAVLDVIAHEYTHAVVQSIVDMDSHGEAASINEAIADIFATAVTFHSGQGDWIIGEKVIPGGIRNLSDPKSMGHPDTYEGENWGEYRTDFERTVNLRQERGMHGNGSIMGHWFYLLCEGGEGENDNEDHYDIERIGMKAAMDIVYKSIFYLTPSITFMEFRNHIVSLTEKMYGECSKELINVTNAWNAVGVGDPFCDCFSGSFDLIVEKRNETARATYYFKENKTAVEILGSDGQKYIVNTTPGDRYRHVQGYEDIPSSDPSGGFLKELFQGKHIVLIQEKIPFESRKAYVAKRNALRTGNKMKVNDYTAYEYNIDGYEVWSTDEVCVALIDMFRIHGTINSGAKSNNFRAFYGFPVIMRAPGESETVRIENIREYDVPDRIFVK
jgi:Zn-dependent metalloprotease